MKTITYTMSVKLIVTDPEEDLTNPGFVADAVKTLLEDNAGDWLLEAIGHPNLLRDEAGDFEVIVGKCMGEIGESFI